MPGKAQEDGKSVGSGSMESLSEVAACKFCRKWQHVKSARSGSKLSLSLEGKHMRSLSVGWQHIR